MSERHRKWPLRMVRGLLTSALLLAPAASHADTFNGGIKATEVCPGAGVDYKYEDVSIDIFPGPSTGLVTFLGGGFEVVTDWMVDGKWGYFAATAQDADFGPITLYGWIRGGRMKGWVIGHDYSTSCIVYG
jgi:hypothetical protein